MYIDGQIKSDIKLGKQHIEHCQDLLNLCCQWWHDICEESNHSNNFSFYIPFYVKIYKQDIAEIILNNYTKAKKEHQIENIYENILTCKKLDQKFLDDNFGRMQTTQGADEFSLMNNDNFLTLVNILKNASNPQGIMN